MDSVRHIVTVDESLQFILKSTVTRDKELGALYFVERLKEHVDALVVDEPSGEEYTDG